jgi:hypothetical protein
MKRKIIVTILSLLIINFFWNIEKIYAITVGPAKIEYKANPGEKINDRLVIINDSQTNQTFYAAFEKFTEVNGEKKFLPSEPTALSEWFKMEKTVTLKPGEQKNIPFTIDIPENAPPGGHFAVIWWGTAPNDSKQVSIVTRAGILVYLEVSGEINEKGSVTAFSLPYNKKIVFELPNDFIVNFKNEGNTYLKPKGEITIRNLFNNKIAAYKVNNKERIIFPNNSQILNIAPQFTETPFALGLYKATLALSWGEKDNHFNKTFNFIVFPWKTILVAFIILLITFLIFFKGIRKYNQWIINKALESHHSRS